MGKKKNRSANFYSDHYWQSADFNRRTFQTYRNWIISLALNRFKWLNLPKTCDERYLEYCLLFNGQATIAHPEKYEIWTSTGCSANGYPNMYANPTAWEAIGNTSSVNFRVTPKNGVIIYDNRLRMPILGAIDLYARRLAAYDRTIDVNLKHQQNPILITVDQSKKNELTQMMKQAAGGEAYILGLKGLEDFDTKQMLLDVPFIGEELNTSKQMLWSEIYTFLGISNLSRKSERMIEDEVAANEQPTDLRALDPLTARREACQILNDRFGMNVDVVWRQDNASDNYNYSHNMIEQVRENA